MATSLAAPGARPLAPEDRRLLFPFLADEEGQLLAGYLEGREYEAGSMLKADGATADFFGFIAQGKLAVNKGTAFPGKHVLVAILEPGAMLGECFNNSGCAGTVTALEPSVLWVMTRERMDLLLAEQPMLGRKLLIRLIQVLSLRLGKAYDRLAGLL